LIRHLDRAKIQHRLLLFEDGPIAESLRPDTEVYILPLSDDIRDARKEELSSGWLNSLGKLKTLSVFILRLSRTIGNLDVDIVHTNSLKADILGGIAGRLARKRVIWHVRDRIADDYLPSRTVRIFRRLARWIPHAIIANSNATLETLHLSPEYGQKSKVATVVHDGFDFAELPSGEAVPQGSLVVGLVGRISPWKGQDVFLNAIHEIHGEFPEARFQVVGSALFGEEAYESRLRALSTELGLDGCVEFCGFVRDIQKHIAKLDLLVHASTIPEPFGQVIIEGMAAGKPVIASRGGGAMEIVVDGVSGVLVTMNDSKALAAAMRELLGDAAMRLRLGAGGRERVQDSFRIELTAAKIGQVYSELCAR
jgi:glycosyltransferase involved in cell wall biosynthesis